MPKLEYIIPCQQIIQDNQTNSMSYIGTIEGLIGKISPVTLPTIFIGLRWIKTKEPPESQIAFTARLRVIDPDEKTISEIEPLEITMLKRRHRHNVVIHNLTFSKPGNYKIVVDEERNGNWVDVGESIITFEVSAEEK